MKTVSINAKTTPEPVGGYSQALLVEKPRRLLFISGQIPESPEGKVPVEFDAQCRLVWSNLVAQLTAADMNISDLAKVTIYLSSRDFAETNSAIRREFLNGHCPALTVIVTGIFDEKWLLEIEAVAAA